MHHECKHSERSIRKIASTEEDYFVGIYKLVIEIMNSTSEDLTA